MSKLVNVSEDAEYKLVGLLCTTPVVQDSFKDAKKLLRAILEQGNIGRLVAVPTEEGVSAVSILAALLEKVNDGSRSQLLNDLADAITRSGNGDPSSATKEVALLATLYNMSTDPADKVGLLAQMIKLASSREPSLLESSTSALGKWMDASRLSGMLDEWNIQPTGRRELYHAAAEGAQTALSKQQFTLLVVETYSKSDVDSIGIEYAKKAAIGAIRDPVSLFVQQRKMLSLPAIEALSQNDAALLGLLKVFQQGKLGDYHAYIQSNGGDSVLAQWGLSTDECTRYMRVLSLCSLAATQEEIPYSFVAKTLQTGEDDVEKWVIAAVSSGLLSAKMDQLTQKVLVERSVVRTFDHSQWQQLSARLALWKRNTRSILDSYKQSLAV